MEAKVMARSSGVRLAALGACLLTACSSPAPAAATDPAARDTVIISVRPGAVYLERSESAQHLNFDFLLENGTGKPLFLERVELTVMDAGGRVVRRDFMDQFSRVSQELVPRRELAPNAPTLVYNPFHSFPASLPLGKLRYEFLFVSKNGKVRRTTAVEVAPVLYETKTAMVLPLRGRMLVREGHDHHAHHRRVDYTEPRWRKIGWTSNFMRYGYDFVVVDETGRMLRAGADERIGESPADNGQHLSFGHPVHAVGAGRVVDVHDGAVDGAGIDVAELERRPQALGGNYVVIDHLNGEYSWFGHLKRGSVRVKPGQTVAQGEIIAEVGSSGDSMAPHLHYELRTGPGITGVEGLPSYFSGFRRTTGGETVTRGQLDTGDIVENP
jgi:hypothetical protein